MPISLTENISTLGNKFTSSKIFNSAFGNPIYISIIIILIIVLLLYFTKSKLTFVAYGLIGTIGLIFIHDKIVISAERKEGSFVQKNQILNAFSQEQGRGEDIVPISHNHSDIDGDFRTNNWNNNSHEEQQFKNQQQQSSIYHNNYHEYNRNNNYNENLEDINDNLDS